MQANLSPKMQAYLLWCEDRGVVFPRPRAVPVEPVSSEPVILSNAKDLPSFKVTFIADVRSADADLDDELLNKMTSAMNLGADDYLVINMADEPEFHKRLSRQKTETIVILGADTACGLLGDDFDFHSARGSWLHRPETLAVPTMVTHHPRDLRRQPASKRDAWQDLQAVMQRLTAAPS